tara:strand:- start:3476 stop:4648 length:1173 start_codon:yes stop_codon:yes gene_type:complete
MITKNINFFNFVKFKKNNIKNKLIKLIKKEKILKDYPLLNSLNKNYIYSYDKKLIKKYKKFNSFNLIGMGGSILGTEAIYYFLKDKIKKNFFFFNNLQNRINIKAENSKANIIVSKSGNTLETISNLNLILDKENKNKNIIITENKNNILRKMAKKLNAEILDHKDYIGGRYSVLSEVGMLPAELMGLNTNKFKKFNELVKNRNFVNSLIDNVSFIYQLIKKGKKNSVLLNYDEKSLNFLKWYQQLTAESLGKKSKGIFPIISTMPKDNHSLLQLYLEGPNNNFFTFFSVNENNSQKINKKFLYNSYPNLKNKSLNQIILSQKKATENVFKKKKIPYRVFDIKKRNEETLGELFTFFILETILLGKLLKVDPFDQPSVELIKKEIKKILN